MKSCAGSLTTPWLWREMGDEAEDLSILPEAQEELEAFKSSLEAMRLTTLLTGEYDR